jgi:hypothetical protein
VRKPTRSGHDLSRNPQGFRWLDVAWPSEDPDFLLRAASDDRCAALFREVRMQIIKATGLHRNLGGLLPSRG